MSIYITKIRHLLLTYCTYYTHLLHLFITHIYIYIYTYVKTKYGIFLQ